MHRTSRDDLDQLYNPPGETAVRKVLDHLDTHARRFIELSPFCCLSSVNQAGLMDVSPRGGDPGFVAVLDQQRLLIPDHPGNNRIDTMRNLMEVPSLGMMFLIPGFIEVLRVNGVGTVIHDPTLLTQVTQSGRVCEVGLVVHVSEVFLHCGRAVRRARLWEPDARTDRSEMPPLAQMLREQIADTSLDPEFDELATEDYLDQLYVQRDDPS